ncbi:Mss4-like protein [Aspergillus karnatakaensis]|uniref:GFA family protein n=1 Tax=Aspergillus karnatakaensis TaxID=1810916 RepID=UPI003CCE4624
MNRLLRIQTLQPIPALTSRSRSLHLKLPSNQITNNRLFSLSSQLKMPTYTGSCTCRKITYNLTLDSPNDARTSLCHCKNCKKAFGTNYGLTAKIPLDSLSLTSGKTKEHVADNGVHREFCDNCGSFICEYGDAVKDKFRYLVVGSLDDPEVLPPKGEFFCKERASWMPEVQDVFHKKEIKE